MVVTSVGWIGEGESAAAGPAELISVDPNTGGALASSNGGPSVSGDGNFVVFSSFFVLGQPDLLFQEDVFLWNRADGSTVHMPQPTLTFPSETLAGTNGGVISRDGCHVVFWGKYFFDRPAGEWNIYEWNRCVAGSISVQIAGGVLDDSAFTQPLAVSADGRYVAYIATQASGLPPLVARIDTTTGLESVLIHPYTNVFSLDISDDGRFVALAGQRTIAGVFTTQIMGWTAPCAATCTTEIVSVNSAGQTASGFSSNPSVSADGRYVAFDSDGTELGGFPPGGANQVYVRDRVAGVTKLVTDTPGQQMEPTGLGVSAGEISPDGSQVAVTQTDGSETSQVWVAHSTSGFYDTSVFDLVSFGVNDQPVSNGANSPSMSSTGRFVAFTSNSSVELSGGTVPDFNSHVWMRERPVALDITATLNFGTIDVGSQSPPLNAVVTNTSGVVINISSVTPPGSPFIITGNSCGGVLPAGGSCVITVVFRPTAAGSASSSITVSGDGLSVTASLVGVGRPLATAGALSINPTAANFGTAGIGATLPARDFVVTNPGQTAVPFSGVSLSGAGADQFAIVTNTCTGSLGPGASCTISVSATVTREGSFSATLSVRGTGGEATQATLRVRGTAQVFTPELVMNPGVVSPGEVTVAVGSGFPPDIDVQLAFADEPPFATVHTDASGAFRYDYLIFRNGIRIGGREILALDQPQFSGVFAPLLIALATFRPSGFASPAFSAGIRSLYRGG